MLPNGQLAPLITHPEKMIFTDGCVVHHSAVLDFNLEKKKKKTL